MAETARDWTMGSLDRWIALALLLFCWLIFAVPEQSPFKLQGAVIEALVERGHLYFVHGTKKGEVFENLDTHTTSFRYLFNVFPYGGVYRVNHAPGQFLLAAPWYALCVQLGWRFETHERLVWRVLVWTLTAPLGALGIVSIFVLALRHQLSLVQALSISLVVALGSPWWPAFGVVYHDSFAAALILIGVTLWEFRSSFQWFGSIVAPVAAGALLAFSLVTTYLVGPIVFVLCVGLLLSKPSRRDIVGFAMGFLPTLSILPVANALAFGSPFATGYSAGGFDQNYPSPLDLPNAWEKIGFYLWDSEYGLVWLYPVFLLGAIGLIMEWVKKPSVCWILPAVMLAHFLFIISMEHHGSVGWGMGRFFLPLYPILAFGLPSLWDLRGGLGVVTRTLVFSTGLYSVVFAAASVGYGVQGVMEPGVPTLKMHFAFDHYQLNHGLPWLALVGGILGEFLYQGFLASAAMDSSSAGKESKKRDPRKAKVAVAPRRRTRK